jgi:hypothetical protein
MTINFNKKRYAILGTTGTGKTVSSLTSLVRQPVPVLFIDTININTENLTKEIKQGFYFISEKFDINKFSQVLKKDKLFLKFINYYKKDLYIDFILNYILDNMKNQEMYICIDEVHLYGKGQKAIERLATTGRNFNKYLISLSQAPQQVSNIILRQSEIKVLFKMDMQKDWFRTYGLPYEKYLISLKDKDIHHYVTYNQLDQVMSPAQKVQISI